MALARPLTGLERVRLLWKRYLLVTSPWRLHGDGRAPRAEQEGVERWVAEYLRTGKVVSGYEAAARGLRLVLGEGEEWEEGWDGRALDARVDAIVTRVGTTGAERDTLWLLLAPWVDPLAARLWEIDGKQLGGGFVLVHHLLRWLDPAGERVAEAAKAVSRSSVLWRAGLVESGVGPGGDDRRRVSPRLVDYLMGRTHGVDPTLTVGVTRWDPPEGFEPDVPLELMGAEGLELDPTRPWQLLCGPVGMGQWALTKGLAATLGVPLYVVDAQWLVRADPRQIRALRLERALTGGLLVVDRSEQLWRDAEVEPLQRAAILRELADAGTRGLLHFGGDPPASVLVEAQEVLGARFYYLPTPGPEVRPRVWRHLLGGEADPEDLVQAASSFALPPETLPRALHAARLHASATGRALGRGHIIEACRDLTTRAISELAVRVESHLPWDAVVLAPETLEQIQEIRSFMRHRSTLFGELGFERYQSTGKALTVLFSGPPGTGKTLVSALLARDLGLDLYRVDLSRVVSKWVGETSKHLSTIFAEASANQVALVFDEADSLFGKRTDVQSSGDRHANLETNHLLQEIEAFDGFVVLTTNFRANLDDAFVRRLRYKVEFPAPEPEERALLWERLIPPEVEQADDIDFDELAHTFELTGGHIRNAVVRAVLYALDEGEPLGHEFLDRAACREYVELGKLPPSH